MSDRVPHVTFTAIDLTTGELAVTVRLDRIEHIAIWDDGATSAVYLLGGQHYVPTPAAAVRVREAWQSWLRGTPDADPFAACRTCRHAASAHVMLGTNCSEPGCLCDGFDSEVPGGR